MPKLFNPFKPHTVRFNNGKYGVRKLSKTLIFGWIYYDQVSDPYWWNGEEYVDKFCSVPIEKLKPPLGSGEYIG